MPSAVLNIKETKATRELKQDPNWKRSRPLDQEAELKWAGNPHTVKPEATAVGSPQTGSRQDAGRELAGSTGVQLQSIEHEGQYFFPGVERQIT
jgi:hypothetical protein